MSKQQIRQKQNIPQNLTNSYPFLYMIKQKKELIPSEWYSLTDIFVDLKL